MYKGSRFKVIYKKIPIRFVALFTESATCYFKYEYFD